jgi:uncharacterized membrane protein
VLEISTRHHVSLEAGGSRDPDGSRAAAVLTAYFHAERLRDIRRRVCRLAGIGIVWLAMTALASTISAQSVLEVFTLLAAAVVGSAVAEWRAGARLTELIRVDEIR